MLPLLGTQQPQTLGRLLDSDAAEDACGSLIGCLGPMSICSTGVQCPNAEPQGSEDSSSPWASCHQLETWIEFLAPAPAWPSPTALAILRLNQQKGALSVFLYLNEYIQL